MEAMSNAVVKHWMAFGGFAALSTAAWGGIQIADANLGGGFSEVKDSLNNSSQRIDSLRQEYKNDSISGGLSSEKQKEAAKLIKQALSEHKEASNIVIESKILTQGFSIQNL